MPGCVLHVSGEDFIVDAFLANSDLRPYRIRHHGDNSGLKRPISKSGFSIDVSSVDGDLGAQILDAVAFLSAHELELQRLRDFPGVSDMRLDFGYYWRDMAAQFDYFPPHLLAQAGKLGIGIALSLYTLPNAGTAGS